MKKFILAVFACFSAFAVSAQTHTMELRANYAKGEAGSIDVYVTSEENDVALLEFFMYVPEGLKFPSQKKCIEDGEAVDEDNGVTTCDIWGVATDGAMANENLSQIAGMTCYKFLFRDTNNLCFNTVGGNCVVRFNYNASDVESLKGLKACKILLGRPGKTKINIEEVAITGINGIAADKAETAQDGKFVENNRVVIKKAGVKYSTTGQVVK